MKYSFLVFSVSIILFAVACEETSNPSRDAVKMTKAEIASSVGYSWFNYEWRSYHPNDSLVGVIESSFDPSVHSFYIFMIPGCSCDSIIVSPVELIKTLDNAGVTESDYFIYSMNSKESNHPFEDLLEINRLPAAYMFRDSLPVYSIIDTLNYRHSIGDKVPIEVIVSEALQAN